MHGTDGSDFVKPSLRSFYFFHVIYAPLEITQKKSLIKRWSTFGQHARDCPWTHTYAVRRVFASRLDTGNARRIHFWQEFMFSPSALNGTRPTTIREGIPHAENAKRGIP